MTRLTQDLALWRGTEGFAVPYYVVEFEASGSRPTVRALVFVALQDFAFSSPESVSRTFSSLISRLKTSKLAAGRP